MKLKQLSLVVASMSTLALLSCPAFAADAPKHKRHHHHKAMHHVVTHDYKDMGALPVQPAPIMNDWYNRIAVDGRINVDTTWGNREMGYTGTENARIAVNNAQVNVKANVNDWAKAFATISYDNTSEVLAGASTSTVGNQLSLVSRPKPGQYETIDRSSPLAGRFEQAFITLGNMDEAPVYLKLGKQYLPFGKYDPHAITRSVTSVMSESLRTAALVGIETHVGLTGSIFAFDNPLRQTSNSHTKTNYGADINFSMPSDALGFDVGLSGLYDITGVQDVAYAVGLFNGSSTTGTGNPSYSNRVGGVAMYGDVNSGPFSLALRYVTALQHFSATDLATRGTVGSRTTGAGAKPWTVDLSGGYKFNVWDKNQNVYLGYQGSQNAVNLLIPKNRVSAGYGVEVWKNTDVGLEFNHDVDYSQADGGTNNSSNQLHLRVGVKFG